jgi:hypothetical protein
MSRRKAKAPRPPKKAPSQKRPAPSPKTGLYFPTDVAPETVFREIGRLRKEAEIEIERLIDLLDRTETYDPVTGAISAYDEREPPVDDEPSLGGGDGRDLEGDYADNEPSLGWPEQFGRGEGGSWGGCRDEEECVRVDDMAARERYVASTLGDPSAGVQVEPNYGCYGPKRLSGLSERQRKILKPKVNRREVSI